MQQRLAELSDAAWSRRQELAPKSAAAAALFCCASVRPPPSSADAGSASESWLLLVSASMALSAAEERLRDTPMPSTMDSTCETTSCSECKQLRSGASSIPLQCDKHADVKMKLCRGFISIAGEPENCLRRCRGFQMDITFCEQDVQSAAVVSRDRHTTAATAVRASVSLGVDARSSELSLLRPAVSMS